MCLYFLHKPQIELFLYTPKTQNISGCLLHLHWETSKTRLGRRQLVFIDNGIGFVRRSNKKLITINHDIPELKLWAIGWGGVDVRSLSIPVSRIRLKSLPSITQAVPSLRSGTGYKVIFPAPNLAWYKNIGLKYGVVKTKIEIASAEIKLGQLSKRLPIIESISEEQ